MVDISREDRIDDLSQNKHSALSGNDKLGDLTANEEEDRRLKREILEQLKAKSDIISSDIHVSVKDSFVSLTGSVSDEKTREAIIDLARGVEGVQDVSSLLKVES
jgi:osmotically-inducible protein OsmY